MEALHTETVNGYTIAIHQDEHAQNPREDGDYHTGLIVVRAGLRDYGAPDGHLLPDNYPCRDCKGNGYVTDSKGDEDRCGTCDGQSYVTLEMGAQWIDVVEWAKREHGATRVMALDGPDGYGPRWSLIATPSDYDTLDNVDGVTFDTAKRRETNGAPDEAVIGNLTAELREYNDWADNNVYGYTITDVNGDEVDSCWGFIGENDETGETWALIDARLQANAFDEVKPSAIATVKLDEPAKDGTSAGLTVTLRDGTVVKAWFHVCPSCTSADMWVHGNTPDPANETGDKHRQIVDVAVWDGKGGRTWAKGTTTNHIIRHDR